MREGEKKNGRRIPKKEDGRERQIDGVKLSREREMLCYSPSTGRCSG